MDAVPRYVPAADQTAGAPDPQRALFTDPQTSGGLLVACTANTEAEVLVEFRKDGFDAAGCIGQITVNFLDIQARGRSVNRRVA